MTTGEKIQYYRKKNGLSQEELGQRLLVSRQTVSLWEMDKTLPTVDNLLRLKSIFSVSIDDILSDSNPIEEKEKEPTEAYVFKYSKADLKEVFQKNGALFIKRAAKFVLAWTLLFVLGAGGGANETFIGLLLGIFLVGAFSHIKGYFAYKKAWQDINRKMLENTYFYELFEEYFVVNISHGEEITKTLKFYFDDIEKVHCSRSCLILQISGQSYIIQKEALIPDSKFLILCKGVTNKVEMKPSKDALKVISILLLVLSVCTMAGALLSVAVLTESNQVMTENMWLFFLFLPVPIASVVFGLCLKKKGYKYKKNVIVGVVMAVFLCIYGSFSFIFSGFYSHSDEPILKVEQLLGIDIPAHTRINTQDWTGGTQSVPRGYIYSTSDIYFDGDVAEEFEKRLSGDTKWISTIPNDMIGITSYFCDVQASDYYLIYNKDTKEFNKMPDESGTYVFINILYNAERNTMKLVEYQIEYTK